MHGTNAQSGQVLGCANIEPSLVAEEKIEISFLRNGTNPEDFNRCCQSSAVIMLLNVICAVVCNLYRVEMGYYISKVAGVPLGDVLVNDVKAVNISGNECLTTSIKVTGVDGMHTLSE